MRGVRLGLALGVAVASLGCESVLPWIGVPFLYREAELPVEQSVLDIPYRSGSDADPVKHRLDLFLPDPSSAPVQPWPVLIFVHGGGWTSGDRALRVGGADVYRNIGRFYAAHGIGTVVISYRLQPAVDWHAQVDDVARAIDWVQANVGRYGGDPGALFLAGHSAGAYLAGRAALDRSVQHRAGIDPGNICGLVLVSGAAFDLEDVETWHMGADPVYYEDRLSNGDPLGSWQHDASVVPLVDGQAPPSLLLFAGRESPALKRQSQVLHDTFLAAGVSSDLVVVPGEDHSRIVLTLSRDDKTAGPAILRFLRGSTCHGVG